MLHDVQHPIDTLVCPVSIIISLHILRQVGRVGKDVGRFVGQDLDCLIDNLIHILLLGHAIIMHLFGPIDAGVATLVVDNGHGIRKEVVKNTQSLLREGSCPFTAFTLHTTQEGQRFHLFIIGIDLLIIGQHTTDTPFARIGSYPIVDAIVHGLGMSDLFGQPTLQMDMIVNDREKLLLQTDDGILLLIHRRQGIVRIDGIGSQGSHAHLPELNRSPNTLQQHLSLSQQPLGIGFRPIGLVRFRVAHHIRIVDPDSNVLPANGHLKTEPFPIIRQRTVKVADSRQATRLARTINRSPVKQHLIARSLPIGMKPQGRFGILFRQSLTRHTKVLIGSGCLPTFSGSQGQFFHLSCPVSTAHPNQTHQSDP